MAGSDAGVEISGNMGATSDLSSDLELTASPRLSRKTQEEVVAENDASFGGNDPENYPLHSTWSFWFDRSPRGADAGDFFANLRCLATVTSIKAFWRVFNNLPSCEKLHDRDSYHVMRDERRRPVWEDADNADGGVWSLKLGKQNTEKIWQDIVLAAVGEQLSVAVHTDDEICGVSVRIRRDTDVIQIWNQDSEYASQATVISRVKELIPSILIKESFYRSNKDKMADSLKVGGGHGVSPPPPITLVSQRRYTGAPPPMFPPSHHVSHGYHGHPHASLHGTMLPRNPFRPQQPNHLHPRPPPHAHP